MMMYIIIITEDDVVVTKITKLLQVMSMACLDKDDEPNC